MKLPLSWLKDHPDTGASPAKPALSGIEPMTAIHTGACRGLISVQIAAEPVIRSYATAACV